MSDGYEKRVTYLFDDGKWEITEVGDNHVAIEETRKNGQEDTHINVIVERGDDGKWVMTEGRGMIEDYGWSHDIQAIESHLNEHGPPGDGE